MDYEFFSNSLLFNDVFKVIINNILKNKAVKFTFEEYGNISRLIVFDVLGENRNDFCPSKRP